MRSEPKVGSGNGLAVALKVHTQQNRMDMRIICVVFGPTYSHHGCRLREKKLPKQSHSWYQHQARHWHEVGPKLKCQLLVYPMFWQA